MNQRTPFLALLLSALIAPGFSAASSRPRAEPLRVVTTIPDLADIAREIGGERVSVVSLSRGTENLHAVQPRPSDLIALSRADVFVQVGLSLESAWVPSMLLSARNERIAAGQPGFVSASAGWTALDVPADVSRKGGDVHPYGNPHMNLSPAGGRQMAARILVGLIAVDPEGREKYEARAAAYGEKLDAAEARWKAIGAKLAGKAIVTYHKEWDYLAAAHGLAIAGTVEVKPGVPPTGAHLAGLVELMRRDKVAAILTARWSNTKQVDALAAKTGAVVLELPTAVGGAKGAETWIGMMDLIHARLAQVLSPATAGATDH